MMISNLSQSILLKFSEDYAQIHGRIVFPLTILGILTSIVTIIILNRKNFQTPTNLILQHVAFFDTIVLLSFNIYSFYFSFVLAIVFLPNRMIRFLKTKWWFLKITGLTFWQEKKQN